jgi:hypothetical protein
MEHDGFRALALSERKALQRVINEPVWLERMARGCWYRLSGDHPDLKLPATARGTRYLIDTDPAKDDRLNPAKEAKEILRRLIGHRPFAHWQGSCGFPAITEAWNGAVFASQFRASGSMIVFGGGHNDYFGSSVHAFDLSTREWSRISDGYVSGAANDYGAGAVYPDAVYPDGSPLPPHTYGYVQYDPVGNDYLLLKGQTELGRNVKATPIAHIFNLESLTWRRGPKHPAAILSSGGWTTWDASRRILWGHSGNSGNTFIGFCPDRENDDVTFGTWTLLYPKKIDVEADDNAMAIDPKRDIIVVVAHAENTVFAIDPSAPERKMARLSSIGERPVLSKFGSIEYAVNLDRLVYYSANDGPQIYSIQAPADSGWEQLIAGSWTWQCLLDKKNRLDPIVDAYSSSSYSVNRSHTFGRFRVASYADADVAVLVRHTDTPVYAIRI